MWIAAYDGLYHSTTRTGFDFRALDKVRTIYAFGFGKAKPGSNYPALYLIGVVNGQYGFSAQTMLPFPGCVLTMMLINTGWFCISVGICRSMAGSI